MVPVLVSDKVSFFFKDEGLPSVIQSVHKRPIYNQIKLKDKTNQVNCL